MRVVVVVVRERAVTKERLGVSGAAVVSSKAVSASNPAVEQQAQP
jgi:hypothetical protein